MPAGPRRGRRAGAARRDDRRHGHRTSATGWRSASPRRVGCCGAGGRAGRRMAMRRRRRRAATPDSGCRARQRRALARSPAARKRLARHCRSVEPVPLRPRRPAPGPRAAGRLRRAAARRADPSAPAVSPALDARLALPARDAPRARRGTPGAPPPAGVVLPVRRGDAARPARAQVRAASGGWPRPLGAAVAARWRAAGAGGDVLVPVPVHAARGAGNAGYDQAELIAAAAAEPGHPVAAGARPHPRPRRPSTTWTGGTAADNVHAAFTVARAGGPLIAGPVGGAGGRRRSRRAPRWLACADALLAAGARQ